MRYATALLTILASSQAMALTDLERAAIYAVDRHTCNLSVDQRLIDAALISVAWENDLRRSEAILVAAEVVKTLERDLRESGKVQEYCEARRVK